jgi:orotate phosphoribosyltransferase
MFLLAEYPDDNNLLYFRPKHSKYGTVYTPFVEGNINPERTLLLFDDAIHKGNAMTEAKDTFLSKGYSEDRIFGYSDRIHIKKSMYPALFNIHDLDKYVNRSG